jgi:DNA-binding IclR family transcriptional regulator
MARPRKDPVDGGTPHSQTLDRGLRLLTAIAESSAPADLAQLADSVGIHRSVAYRLVRTLEDHKLVRCTGDHRYEPGIALAALSAGVRRPVQAAALPELTRLAAQAGATAFLAVPDGAEAVTLASVEPPSGPAHVAYRPGTRHPVELGAPGLAILAGGPRRPGERPEVNLARRRGYASSRGEVLPGLSAVAAPVLVGPSGAEVVVGAVALVFLHVTHDAAVLGPLAAESAAQISTNLRAA